MLESLSLSDSTLPSTSPDATSDKPPRRKKRWVAAILSFLFPGLGQVYAGYPRRGMTIALTLWAISFLVFHFRLLQYPAGLFLWIVAGLIVLAAVMIDAAVLARRESESRKRIGWRSSYIAMASVVVVSAIFPRAAGLPPHARPFKVPSASMCPTICEHERIIADMTAYKNRMPERGDLILLRQPSFGEVLLIKRVIATGGDTVRQGSQGEILVNGRPLAPLSICDKPRIGDQMRSEAIDFESTTVPGGSFFVAGDNLNNSLDSRTREFGFVTGDQIRGKPLYLYWSPVFSRIGCKVR
jgi:signal peptidase I